MRKLFISTSVALALGLTGCGGSNETLEDIESGTPVQKPFSRVVFDRSSAVRYQKTLSSSQKRFTPVNQHKQIG